MNKRQLPPSATSLPRAPQDEAAARMKRYAWTMGIRTLCFLLMALVQPFGWWTWVFGAGAIFLPYIAVVFANNAAVGDGSTVEAPQQSIAATAERPQPMTDTTPGVLRISETPPAAPRALIEPPPTEPGEDPR